MGDILKTLLINVETILTDYVERSTAFWQEKANQIQRPLPHDFMESFLSAGDDALEKFFFRFPHFQAFHNESNHLFQEVNKQLNDSNGLINQLHSLKQSHDLHLGLIYDQKRNHAKEIAHYLQNRLSPITQVFADDAALGKPEGNIFLKAKILSESKANEIWVIDGSKNGILAAFLANIHGIYIDMGLGLTERIFKYSYRNLKSLEKLEALLIQEKNKPSSKR